MGDSIAIRTVYASTDAQHANLGNRYTDSSGRTYVFVRCNEAAGLTAATLVTLNNLVWDVEACDADDEHIFGIVPTVDGDIDDNDYFWVQVGGLYQNAPVTGTPAVGLGLASVCDASFRFQAAADTNWGVRAVTLEVPTANVGDIYLHTI